ncbi:His Kinase A (phospho-acceptor) domain-containing protein [Pedobacter suwonensis]|uniref:histidine kinase n=2 Tax=Pedobacter suwonensis TaxID=332999 RepID=A0A1I0TJG1_9SPHI|nr:His Kinase A (phospho-acceptor) domain-containing protein [Pedobacter suwonensis]
MMSCCVLGIVSLQLYWNFKNYNSVVANFKKDTNNALDIAVEREMMQRRKQLVSEVKKWMNNPSIVKITCDTNNKDHSTAFTLTDAIPYYADEKADQVTMGISSFNKKVGRINPEAKKVFIEHFSKILMNDLKDATVHYYTQGIGHRLDRSFNESRLDSANLIKIYKEELAKRQISTSFKLNTMLLTSNSFVTHKVNTAFRRPYVNSLVFASLENPNSYYLRQTKWLVIGSVSLIGITLSCFYYTVKTLFNQHKLVAIKNQFISNMTHEINTPLSSIQVTAEALKKFKPNEETTEKYLEIILYQTQKLNDLTNEILESAKLDTLKFSMEDMVDLKQLISEILADLCEVIKIQLNFEAGDFIIMGNRVHLQRLITNLLENAIKYNIESIPEISVDLEKINSGILLRIIDNGPGIADEHKSKIFDQFYRIPTGNMHNVKGYGLGLNYVKKVVSQHGGSISVSDNKPSGAIFTLIFPAK